MRADSGPHRAEQAIQRVLIANRGEIAIRIARACREAGLVPVAVYGEGERNAPHARAAADAYRLPESSSGTLPYLDIDAVVATARRAECQAVHPGYGFLAENAAFAAACVAAGLIFIGPSAGAIRAMGDKVEARRLAASAGVPIVPGTDDPVADADTARSWADANGYPVAVKASGGGGGRGFRVAWSSDEIADAFAGSVGEATRYFANPAVYLEQYLVRPRHVEIQLMADSHGHTVALGERDCSIQRRHQKLIEETPSPALTAATRAEMSEAAVRLARAVEYVGAATVEFLLDENGKFYFLEMNTRIQVEHPVTEMVTGIDLIAEQLRIARGKPLSFDAASVEARGHAIECRVNAEDTTRSFAPSPGLVTEYREPAGFGVRVDSAMEAGEVIHPAYDSMIAKLIVWGRDRSEAIARMERALADYVVGGVPTTIDFHRRVMAHQAFRAGDATTTFLTEYPELLDDPAPSLPPATAEPAPDDLTEVTVEVNGRRLVVRLPTTLASGSSAIGGGLQEAPRMTHQRGHGGGSVNGPDLTSPIQGTVVRLAAEPGQVVQRGEVVAVIEAMKMENEIGAHRDGTVSATLVEPGASVRIGTPLVSIDTE